MVGSFATHHPGLSRYTTWIVILKALLRNTFKMKKLAASDRTWMVGAPAWAPTFLVVDTLNDETNGLRGESFCALFIDEQSFLSFVLNSFQLCGFGDRHCEFS